MLMRVTVLWESREPEMGNRGMETKEASGGQMLLCIWIETTGCEPYLRRHVLRG